MCPARGLYNRLSRERRRPWTGNSRGILIGLVHADQLTHRGGNFIDLDHYGAGRSSALDTPQAAAPSLNMPKQFDAK